MKKIEIVFFDAGGGLRSAATALREVCAAQGCPWQVNLLNLQELLDELDISRRLTGIRIQDIYNLMLKNGWTWGSAHVMRVLQAFLRFYHNETVRLLEPVWEESRPDLVLSVIPHFNRALFQSLRNISPQTPFVTLLTDLADFPPHFWLERQPQYFICGTEHAVAQTRELGIQPSSIFLASGMILHPRFYQPFPDSREFERRRLGLHPHLPTGIVLFGGQGSQSILEIAQRLHNSSLDLQLILMCGKNRLLASRLRQRRFRFPVSIQEFTREIPAFMHLSDFFIGKPGPGSISEALAMRLPVIVQCNSSTLPQERFNARWIREKGVGLVVTDFAGIPAAAAALLRPADFLAFRANAAAMHNRAVFEIPGFLQSIFDAAQSSPAASAPRGRASGRP